MNDPKAFWKIGYGLYVLTSREGDRDNGMICNTVMQVTGVPEQLAVAVNKSTYSHEIIRHTGRMNINVLDVSAPFELFRNFGFRTGRGQDKFAGIGITRSENGLAVLQRHCNAFFSLQVEQYMDLGTHGLFICRVAESGMLADTESMTYSYYQEKVKPRPAPAGKKGFVCKVCGYVYEGDTLPPDFICPVCGHPAADFVPLAEDTENDVKDGRYVCSVCGYVYDPAKGDPEHGVPPGTAFKDLPADWKCPVCGAPKEKFRPVK